MSATPAGLHTLAPSPTHSTSRCGVLPAPRCEPTGAGAPGGGRCNGVPVPPRSRRTTPADRTATPQASGEESAVAFIDTTLRTVLEVVDRRRPAGHLVGYLTEPAIASVTAYCLPGQTVTGSPTGAARIHRVRVQWLRTGVAEIFGTYSRAGRLHAFAGRIEALEQRPPGVGSARFAPICAALPARRHTPRPRPDWVVSALRLG